jgi:hypothetical protein
LQLCLEISDISGDCFTTLNVVQNQQKPWVAKLATPYVIVFSIGGFVSLLTMVQKGRLLLERLRSGRARNLAAARVESQWHSNLAVDAKMRQAWIKKLLSNDEVYHATENNAVAIGSGLFDVFKMDAAAVVGTKYRMKYDEATKRLLGRAFVTIRGTSAEEIVAYLMENNRYMHLHRAVLRCNVLHTVSKHGVPCCNTTSLRVPVRSKITRTTLTASDIRDEVLEDVNGHCIVIFNEMRIAPFANRTWLNMGVWKRVSDEPRTYIWVLVPIQSHKGLRTEVPMFPVAWLDIGTSRSDYVPFFVAGQLECVAG